MTFGGVPLDDELVVCQVLPPLSTVSITARVVGGIVFDILDHFVHLT